MALIETEVNSLHCDSYKRRFGWPDQLGEWMLGVSKLGDTNPKQGVYQRRHTRRGVMHVRMKYPRICYSTSEAVLASRQMFADAMAAWAITPPASRTWWNNQAHGKNMHGMNLFIKVYFESH